MTSPDDTMVTGARAAEIAGISRQRLYYWEKTELVVPTVRRVISQRNIIRLYDISALMGLIATARLVEGPLISTQHVRAVLERLRGIGYDHPAGQLVFAIAGSEIYFQHADGTWEGSRAPDQTVARVVLPLDEIRAHIRSALQRRDQDHGRVERVRRVRSSKPVFAGTRVPVSAVRDYLEAGRPDAEILAAFPELTEQDLESARSLDAVAG